MSGIARAMPLVIKCIHAKDESTIRRCWDQADRLRVARSWAGKRDVADE